MNHPSLEKAESYISLQFTRTGRGLPPPPAGLFVTISRESGAGASSLARLVADKLNCALEPGQTLWRVYDGNLVESMLHDLHYPPNLARFLPEDSISEIDSSIGELVGLHPNLWELVQHTNCLMRQLAGQGRCILIGRGANFATAGVPHGLHLRLVGDAGDRALHMARHRNQSTALAREMNAKADAARRRYVSVNFNRDIDDPTAYDLVVNTSTVPLAETAELLVDLIAARTPVEVA